MTEFPKKERSSRVFVVALQNRGELFAGKNRVRNFEIGRARRGFGTADLLAGGKGRLKLNSRTASHRNFFLNSHLYTNITLEFTSSAMAPPSGKLEFLSIPATLLPIPAWSPSITQHPPRLQITTGSRTFPVCQITILPLVPLYHGHDCYRGRQCKMTQLLPLQYRGL